MWQQSLAPRGGYSWIAGSDFCMLRCMTCMICHYTYVILMLYSITHTKLSHLCPSQILKEILNLSSIINPELQKHHTLISVCPNGLMKKIMAENLVFRCLSHSYYPNNLRHSFLMMLPMVSLFSVLSHSCMVTTCSMAASNSLLDTIPM